MAIHLHTQRHPAAMSQATTQTSLREATSFAIAVNRDLLHVYGEPAFHYFLDIERARSLRSVRVCVLLRVDLKDRNGVPTQMPPATSDQLFIAIAHGVRETDFMGWYEDQRVAGAVLTEVAEGQQNESIRRAVDRIRRSFDSHFPVTVSSRLDIRVTTVRDERAWS